MNLSGPSMDIHHPDDSQFSVNNAYQQELTFRDFVFHQKFNRQLLIVTSALVVLAFCIFKYIYPYAGFINGDSYQYIASAFYNLRVDIYPIGYPKFIRLFSVFSYNDTCLIAFQYLLFEISTITFLYSLFYFFNSSSWMRIGLLILIAPNPIFLFMANYISSDCLFLALSVFWFTTLIWIIHQPTLKLLALHCIIICMAFMVRYNALFYPFVSLLAFVVNNKKILLKILGFAMIVSVLGIFINYTANQFERITGAKQFTPFSGWQLANNALYAYRFIDSSDRVELPARFKMLDQDVRNYFDTTRNTKEHPQEMLIASTVYMWDSVSPLRIYMNKQFIHDSTKGELTRWASVAPLYNEYGAELIKTYPEAFINYYIWPNFLKFYVPPVEFLEYYSTNVDTVPIEAKQWFWFKNNKLTHRTKEMKVTIFSYYPIFSAAINVIYLTICFSLFYLIKVKYSEMLIQLWIVVTFYWLCNLGFSVLASPVALRFQLFPLTLCTAFSGFIIDQVIIRINHSEAERKTLIDNSIIMKVCTEHTI